MAGVEFALGKIFDTHELNVNHRSGYKNWELQEKLKIAKFHVIHVFTDFNGLITASKLKITLQTFGI